MLCQICNSNTADIKISHVINDKKIEIDLCMDCADEKGINNPLVNLPQFFGNFLSQLVGEDFLETRRVSSGKKCPGCGTNWDEFESSGLFGCDICYQFFEEDLDVVLRRIHGSNRHIGSRPKSMRHSVNESELRVIRADLERAIQNEQFENAAKLRDIIRDAQRETNKKADDRILR